MEQQLDKKLRVYREQLLLEMKKATDKNSVKEKDDKQFEIRTNKTINKHNIINTTNT